MTEAELAWLAGLLEGEGSFRCGSNRRPDRKSQSVYLHLQLSMTDEDVIRRAAALYGAPVCGPYQRGRPSDKYIWVADVHGYKAEVAMRLILPLMGLRRTVQITEALAKWDARPRKHRQTGLPPTCHPDRKHHSKGLCIQCYQTERWDRRKTGAEITSILLQ